jgi:hypothetical protein
MAASLLFWGWQTGAWIAAMLMALALEAAARVRFRWEFGPSDFNRASDLCAVLLFGTIVYEALSQTQGIQGIFITVVTWLPAHMFPLMFAQNYSTDGQIDLRSISLILRNKGEDSRIPTVYINLNYPYAGLCILSASFANIRDMRFYAGLMLLSVWILGSFRPKHYPIPIWVLAFILASITGYGGHVSLHQLQRYLEVKGVEWFEYFDREDADPFLSQTGLGYIGQLKPSNRILFRVKSPDPSSFPLLLREAAYDHFNAHYWYVQQADFIPVQPGKDERTWNLGPPSDPERRVTVSIPLKNGTGILKLPLAAFQVQDLPVLRMERNPLGAVKVQDGPGHVTYDVRFGNAPVLDRPPVEQDLLIPKAEMPAIAEVVQHLGLSEKSPDQVLETLSHYFENHFTYSLDLNPRRSPTALAYFLRESHSGHCEYFASATVLLLRAAGIPARYATGFSVHESGLLDEWVVVRTRHAHAWALACVNGVWQNVDNTPSSWRALETEAAPAWQFMTDVWSWIGFKFSRWRWRETRDDMSNYLLWVLIPLVLFILRRLMKSRMTRVREESEKQIEVRPWPGDGSPFYAIEAFLNRLGYERRPHETLRSWLARIADSENFYCDISTLYPLLNIHYRSRFDPRGITDQEGAVLSIGVREWIERNHR